MKGKKDDMRHVNITDRFLDLADDEEGWFDVDKDGDIGRGGSGGKRTRGGRSLITNAIHQVSVT